MPQTLFDFLDDTRESVVALQRELVSTVALGPENGGQGEKEKCDLVRARLEAAGVPVLREMRSPDERVACGYRPNLAARIPGEDDSRTLWVIAHLDVVPAGDLSQWRTDPFALHVEGDVILGRGVEDNHQAAVCALLVAEGIRKLELTPKIGFGLLFAADEETGNTHGLDYVVREHADLFGLNDLFLVPDYGQPDSAMIEVAEKSMLWLKVTVTGKQCHASVPDEGNNSLVAAAALILKLRELGEVFDARDTVFSPPSSTFEPTKKEANVENVNTVPGRDVFYVDCRVLPEYSLDDVLAEARRRAAGIASIYGVGVDIDTVQREQAADPTPADAEVVERLTRAVRSVYGVEPRPQGIGGGTVAAVLRRAGHEAAVWATLQNNAHQPNERASIANTIGDAKVMAHMLFS